MRTVAFLAVLAVAALGCARVVGDASPGDADAGAEVYVAPADLPICASARHWPLACPTPAAGACSRTALTRQLEAELSTLAPVGVTAQYLVARRDPEALVAPIRVMSTKPPSLALGGATEVPVTMRAFLPLRDRTAVLDCPAGAPCVVVTIAAGGARTSWPVPEGLEPRGLVSPQGISEALCAHGRGVFCFEGDALGWVIAPDRLPGPLVSGAGSFVAGATGTVLRLSGTPCRVPVDTTADIVQLVAYDDRLALRTAGDLLLAGDAEGVRACDGSHATALALGHQGLWLVEPRGALLFARSTGTCEARSAADDVLSLGLVSGGVYDNPVVLTPAGLYGTALFGVD